MYGRKNEFQRAIGTRRRKKKRGNNVVLTYQFPRITSAFVPRYLHGFWFGRERNAQIERGKYHVPTTSFSGYFLSRPRYILPLP